MNNLFSIFLVVVTIVPAKNAKEEKRKYSDDENDEHRIRSVQKKLFWLWGAALRKKSPLQFVAIRREKTIKGVAHYYEGGWPETWQLLSSCKKNPIFMKVWFDFVGKETAE